MKLSRPRLTASLLFLTVLASGGVMLAQSDFAVGSIIRGFDFPSRDAKTGKMQYRITGDKAIVMTANRIEVHKLKIEIFNDDKVGTTIQSPVSDYWRLESRRTSNVGVEILWPGASATSKQMEWDLPKSKGVLRGNVVVTIENLQSKTLK
jgi:hypothetical protein